MISAARVAVRSAQGPEVTLPGPQWGSGQVPRPPSSHPWVQSCAQILVQTAPRGLSPGTVVTLPLFQDSQSTSGTPRWRRPRHRPAGSHTGCKPSASLPSPAGAPRKPKWLTLEKQAPDGEEAAPGCAHRSCSPWRMESAWLPSSGSSLQLPSAGAAGAVSGGSGGCGSSGQVVQAASRALLTRKLPSQAGWARVSQAPRCVPPGLLVRARPVRCTTGPSERLGKER